MRRVRGLISVEECPQPANRRGGTASYAPSAGDGLRYERDFVWAVREKGLPTRHGQWLKFRDGRGTAYCQLDGLTLVSDKVSHRIIIWECKLTQKAEGEVKLRHLYLPLARQLYKVPVFPILVFQNILWEPKREVKSIEEVITLPLRDAGKIHHLHWIG